VVKHVVFTNAIFPLLIITEASYFKIAFFSANQYCTDHHNTNPLACVALITSSITRGFTPQLVGSRLKQMK